jgi:hypothetical protein
MKDSRFSGDREIKRVVVDDRDGTQWRVAEVDAARVPGARGDACLCFECPTAIRRVWHYPPDWVVLSDTDLLRVSWGT